MSASDKTYPIIDLHCDLLHYLVTEKDADPNKTEDIGCAIPHLQDGNVKLQVMAMASVESPPDIAINGSQVEWYKLLLSQYRDAFSPVNDFKSAQNSLASDKVGIVASIESASILVDETEAIEIGLDRLHQILDASGKIFYISLTHHIENRFGGGNSTEIGLKPDGEFLLNFLNGRGIAVDFSHTSDPLAYDILNFIDKHNLDIIIIASHSNFREISEHPRNLPDDIALEIINRKGLIGMNFVRAFLHESDTKSLLNNIEYGLKLGAENALCLGADYFYTKSHADRSRVPFYFEGFEHAGRYPEILKSLSAKLDDQTLENFAYKNVMKFLERVW